MDLAENYTHGFNLQITENPVVDAPDQATCVCLKILEPEPQRGGVEAFEIDPQAGVALTSQRIDQICQKIVTGAGAAIFGKAESAADVDHLRIVADKIFSLVRYFVISDRFLVD